MEKKEDKIFYICIAAAAILGYAVGNKKGYKKYEKEMIRDWRQVNLGPDVNLHLYYPKWFEHEVVGFFKNIEKDLVELKQIKGGNK